MKVNYYQTDFDFFTVLVGDDVYAAINSLPNNAVVMKQSGETSAGRTVFNTIPRTAIYGAVVISDAAVLSGNTATIYNLFTNCIPLTHLKKVAASTIAVSEYHPFKGHPNKRTWVNYRANSASALDDLAFYARFYSGSSYYQTPNADVPYGAFNGHPPYYISISILYCNSSMTSWGYISFIGGRSAAKEVEFSHYTITGSKATFLTQLFSGVTPITPPWVDTDPYYDIPESGPSTPSGTYDFTTSDKINVPALPSLSAVSTGFVSLWSPTEAQMLQLSSFMWNANPLTIEFWKKIVADPMQLIYGLNIVPLDLNALGMIDSTGEVVVGLISTGVSMNHLSGQWVELDCGTVTLDETWSAYLDYDPYTKLEIYLPYCGTHPLRVDDFMPGAVKLKYHIDLLSGACVAILTATKSNKHGDTLDSVVYQFMGNCAAQIPVTASQYADAVRSVIQLAASIGTMIAGAAGAGAAVAAETSALPASAGLAISSGAHQASAMVENVMGIKPNVERSGAIGATGGLLSVQKPYLILTRPRQARPEMQNKYTGYPSFITETLGELEGWTQIQAIHLEAIPCTADELSEIDELLKSGVIF